MKPFGESLREARLARGVALDTIANGTRISRHYLDALERTDVKGLPGGAFNKGYIRSYAEFLGVDPEPILEAYSEEARRHGLGTAESDAKMLQEISRILDRKAAPRRVRMNRLGGAALAGIGLATIVLGGWAVMRSGGQDVEPAPDREVRVPPAEPVPPPADPPKPSSSLSVPSSGVGTGVVKHELVGRNDRFPGGTVVWFWTRVVGAEKGEALRHVWKRDGETMMVAKLTLGGAHWRTHSRYELPEEDSGRWTVEAQTADGRVIAREEFVAFASAP